MEVHDRVDQLRAEWDGLADAVGAKPWYRPGWFEAWLEAFGGGRAWILASRDGTGLRGVLPLLRGRGTLRSASNWHSPDFGMLARDEGARVELARATFNVGATWIRLSLLEPANGLAELTAEGTRRRHRAATFRQTQSPYVQLGVGGDAVLAGGRPDKKRAKAIIRARANLEGMGPLELDVRDGSEGLETLLDEGFALEGSGWKTTRGTAIASDPVTYRFYVDLARWAARAGFLRLCFLRVGGRAIAFEYVLDDDVSLYDLKGGYDRDLRRCMPGYVIADALIAHARSLGRQSFEFLGEDESFKLEWTDRTRDRVAFAAFSPTALGLAAYAAHTYIRPVAKRMLTLRDTSHTV